MSREGESDGRRFVRYLFDPNPSPAELALNGAFVSGLVMVIVPSAPSRYGMALIGASLYLLGRYEVFKRG